jgi:pyruvate/2-oxoglutarate dehydrogenase complex dihydrolipoamide acyltransferase (E2) component
MPRLGYDSEVGKIGAWTSKVGDTVTAGQPIGELETEAPVAGTLVEIVHAAGAEVAVGAVIAYVEDGK